MQKTKSGGEFQGAENCFSAHDWAVVEFLDRVKNQLIAQKLKYWQDRCVNSPDRTLRHNVAHAFRYIVELRKDYLATCEEPELLGRLQRGETLPDKLIHRAIGLHGHLLFNSKYYGVARAFGTTSLVPILPGKDAELFGVPRSAVQQFFSQHGLPYYINPDFIATYESQLLPCNAGLTPYQVTLFEKGRVRRVTSIPYLLADLSILHKREDFVQGHLSALVAVLQDDLSDDAKGMHPPLGAYVLTCVVPDAFSETDVWRLNQVVDGALTLGMLSTLQSKQQWATTRGAHSAVLLDECMLPVDSDIAEETKQLKDYLRQQISTQLDTGLLALTASAGAGETRLRGAAVNFDGIYQLLETLFPVGPWLAPALVSNAAELPDGGDVAGSDPLDVPKLQLLCRRLVSVFDSDESTCEDLTRALLDDFPLYRKLLEAVCPEVRGSGGPMDPAALVRVWHFEEVSPDYVVMTIGRCAPEELDLTIQHLRKLSQLASIAARLASMPEGENRIFAEVERAWSADYSGNGSHSRTETDSVIARAEQFLVAIETLQIGRSELKDRHSEAVTSVRDSILVEVQAVLSSANGVRGVLLVRKRTIYVPDVDGWADDDFRSRYLSYASFWLFERLSQVFGTEFLNEMALTDPAIPRIGQFVRRQDHYPYVEVRGSSSLFKNESISTLLNFLGVPVSKWSEDPDQRPKILVGSAWFTSFTAAYRHYLNLLMRSAPSLGSLSRIFSRDLLSLQLQPEPVNAGVSSSWVDHELIINGSGGEPKRTVVRWHAHDSVEVECACLDHSGIFDAWTNDGTIAAVPGEDVHVARVSALRVGEEPNASEEFVESVLLRFEKAARTIQSENTRNKLKQSEELNRTRSDAIGHVGHDAGNALNVLIGNVDLFKEELIDSEKLTGIVTSYSKFLLYTLTNLVDMHRLDRGELEPDKVKVSLQEVVGDVCGWYAAVASARRKTIHNRLEGGPDFHVVSDSMVLRRIVSNLIDNAVKYIPSGSTVSVDAVDEGEMIDLRVTDTGNGIPHDKLAELMMPFKRGDDSVSGVGIGLPASIRIAKLMGGTLDPESVEGEGATFHLRLPKWGVQRAGAD